jgi:uncharacterized membrane protein YfhO
LTPCRSHVPGELVAATQVPDGGQPAPLLRANEGFQAVQIPSGRHHIRLTYADRAFQTGAAISIPAWLACLACLLLVKTKW